MSSLSIVRRIPINIGVMRSFARTIPIRIIYVKRVKDLKKLEYALRASGKNSEQIAKILNRKRRAIGRLLKNKTPQPFRDLIYKRNSQAYNDIYGPTWKALRAKGKSWESIIESASRPGNSFKHMLRFLSQALK